MKIGVLAPQGDFDAHRRVAHPCRVLCDRVGPSTSRTPLPFVLCKAAACLSGAK